MKERRRKRRRWRGEAEGNLATAALQDEAHAQISSSREAVEKALQFVVVVILWLCWCALCG
jgi:hypothetical protein